MRKTILNLAFEDGIYASGRDEMYGCVFGRDTAITVLKLLSACETHYDQELLAISKRALFNLTKLQGKVLNKETGEEPGKFIHEFRWDGYEHLLSEERPWYIDENKCLKNFDSIDATPLALIAIHEYWRLTRDDVFLFAVLPSVRAGLSWILSHGDVDGDGLIEFHMDPERRYGGLAVHSWTDSWQAFADNEGKMPEYPIAPAEVQGYGWAALKRWAEWYRTGHPAFAEKLEKKADAVKRAFNAKLLLADGGKTYAAQALDGRKRQIKTITGNPLLCLWASVETGVQRESIIDDVYVGDFVARGFQDDLFDADAGIRTMSVNAPTYNPNRDSYHNGSFWPVLNGMIYEGLTRFGFAREADLLKRASLAPIHHFGTAIEVYQKDAGGYAEFVKNGQVSCREQAWSAASILHMLSDASDHSLLEEREEKLVAL